MSSLENIIKGTNNFVPSPYKTNYTSSMCQMDDSGSSFAGGKSSNKKKTNKLTKKKSITNKSVSSKKNNK